MVSRMIQPPPSGLKSKTSKAKQTDYAESRIGGRDIGCDRSPEQTKAEE
jgi:hypothetical protein